MNKLTLFEYNLYRFSFERLQEIKREHAYEEWEARNKIHPTRTSVDYGTGLISSESFPVEEFACYMWDMEQKHKQIEAIWQERVDIYKRALKQLTDGEKEQLKQHANNRRLERKVKMLVEKELAADPSFNEKLEALEMIEDMEEYDKRIEAMSDDELLEDYEDYVEGDLIKRQCIKLREEKSMTYSQLASALSITRARAKQIILEHKAKLNEKELRIWKRSVTCRLYEEQTQEVSSN